MEDRKKAWITGGNSGIGFACAEKFASNNYSLVLFGRDEEKLERSKDYLTNKYSGLVKTVRADLTNSEEFNDTFNSLNFQTPDVLINNAGYNRNLPFTSLSPKEIENIRKINFDVPIETIRRILPQMIQRGSGHIINIGSIASIAGGYGHSVYSASKSALATFTKSLAMEYESLGVNFSIVHPEIVETPFFEDYTDFPKKRLKSAISPERVGSTVYKLIDKPKLETYVPQTNASLLRIIQATSPTLANILVRKGSSPKK